MTAAELLLAVLCGGLLALTVTVVGLAAWKSRRWPEQGPASKYGEVDPSEVRRIVEQSSRR